MKELPNRKLNRLHGYDYSEYGYYFVTICTKNREKFFGKIQGSETVLNEYGKIVEKQWLWLAQQYRYIQLDKYIIMPNHMHGILIIRRDRSRPVPTITIVHTKTKSLSQLIGAFKTTSSKIIRLNGLTEFFWQRSFYDHIIHDEKSLFNIREYIQNNPLRSKNDLNVEKNFI